GDRVKAELTRLVEEWPAEAPFGERQERGPVGRRQAARQAEHLPFGAAEERRRHQLDDVHGSSIRWTVCPSTASSQPRQSWSDRPLQSYRSRTTSRPCRARLRIRSGLRIASRRAAAMASSFSTTMRSLSG